MRTYYRGLSGWVALGVILFVFGCGGQVVDSSSGATSGPPLTSTELLAPGGFGVGVTTMTFVDTSRPTMPNGDFPGAPSRTLITEIWYPADPGPAAPPEEQRNAPVLHGGPYPLIIYSHGFMSVRRGGTFLAQHLASYGYVVAAPDFPLTNAGAPGGPAFADVVEQPGDVSVIIDRVLALGADAHSSFAGAIDAQRIGLTGLSLGGTTTFLAAFHPTLRDPRVRAAAPMAGVACMFDKDFYGARKIPLLILHGDIDAIVAYQENGVFAFSEANPPKYLVTIIGGSHTGFTDGIELFDETVKNPDDIGCRALSGVTGGDETSQSFLDQLGGTSAGVFMGDCPQICVGPRPRSIRSARQHELTILSIFPFFEATLRNDARAGQFVAHTLVAENPELTLQSAP